MHSPPSRLPQSNDSGNHVTGSDKIRRLYIVNETDVSDNAVTFWADIDGFLVEIFTVYNSRSEAVEIVQSFDFGRMSEVVNSITSE